MRSRCCIHVHTHEEDDKEGGKRDVILSHKRNQLKAQIIPKLVCAALVRVSACINSKVSGHLFREQPRSLLQPHDSDACPPGTSLPCEEAGLLHLHAPHRETAIPKTRRPNFDLSMIQSSHSCELRDARTSNVSPRSCAT